jgi:N utilization substance protein B
LSLTQFTSKTDADDRVFVLDEADRDFINCIYMGVIKSIDDYRSKVSALARGFKEERLFKVDLAILMMAVYELENTDTPVAVVINEAVELGKIYSTENSAGFINGILAEYTKEQKKD